MINRREFLSNAIAVVLASRLGAAHAVAAAATGKKLTLLIIGDGFVATQAAEAAKRRGHTVTRVDRTLRRNAPVLVGKDKAEFTVAEGQRWDAVIDTSARVPVHVTRLPPAIVSGAGYYLLLSSTSVYANLDKPGIDESAPLQKTKDANTQRATDATAGALQALCETAAEKAMPGRTCVLRSGLTCGPGDPTGRFTYWPVRVARGGDVLAPGKPTDFIQFIDVRDLADFIVLCAERKTLGTFNVDGKGGTTTMGALLDACKKASKSDAKFIWASQAFLAQHRISFYRDLPVWIPAGGEYIGAGQLSSAKAQAAGLLYRPLGDTVKDTLNWYNSDPAAEKTLLKAGLTSKREAEALKAFQNQDRVPARRRAHAAGGA